MATKGGDKAKVPEKAKVAEKVVEKVVEKVADAKPKKAATEVKEAKEGGGLMDDLKNKQAFKKFSFRGEDITAILAKPTDELAYLILINL